MAAPQGPDSQGRSAAPLRKLCALSVTLAQRGTGCPCCNRAPTLCPPFPPAKILPGPCLPPAHQGHVRPLLGSPSPPRTWLVYLRSGLP